MTDGVGTVVSTPSIDFGSIFKILFGVIDPIVSIILKLSVGALALIFLFSIYVIIRLRINPFTRGYRKVIKLIRMDLNFKLLDFMRWIYIDKITSAARALRFKPFGLLIFCGRQGAGKSISMVEYANRIRARYLDCIIVANFKYKHADYYMTDWKDLLNIRNGKKGVLFLIDEIHGEYSSSDWKDFPEHLLSEISMQRKQCVQICASSQVFSRVVKQIREQSFSVVQCFTFANRWTFTKTYDAIDYEIYCESPEKMKKLKPIKYSFIQDNELRNCYDTYEKIKRMKKISERPAGKGFIPRNERNMA